MKCPFIPIGHMEQRGEENHPPSLHPALASKVLSPVSLSRVLICTHLHQLTALAAAATRNEANCLHIGKTYIKRLSINAE